MSRRFGVNLELGGYAQGQQAPIRPHSRYNLLKITEKVHKPSIYQDIDRSFRNSKTYIYHLSYLPFIETDKEQGTVQTDL